MIIIADENIPYVAEAFSIMGEVKKVSGRNITNKLLCKERAQLLLVRSVTKVNEKLLRGSCIKFVGTATIGTDHVDTDWLAKNAIGFASAPGANANSVAEYCIAALIHLSKILNISITGKTIGIIGAGNVGSILSHKVKGIGLRPLVCDPIKKNITNDDIYLSQDELLQKSDIVSLHVPLTVYGAYPTLKMANRTFFDKMRNNSIFINTSRGMVVDEIDLKIAMPKFCGTILDVWQNEPDIDLSIVKKATIATSHIAGYSFDGKLNGTQMIYNSGAAFFNKSSSWNSESILLCENRKINFSKSSKNIVADAISAAYPIMADDLKFKKLHLLPKDDVSVGFDALRKNYPKRLDFSHYEIGHSITPTDLRDLLTLGFKQLT